MRAKIFLFMLGLSLFLTACKEKNAAEISGKWQTEYTLRTGFSESEDSENDELFFNIEQKICCDFFEDGKYTKKVRQTLKSIENPKAIAIPQKEEIAKQTDNTLTISGVYQTKKNALFFGI